MIQWLVFLALAWGSSFLFIKIGVTYVGPLTLVSGRFLIALIAVALLSWKQGTPPLVVGSGLILLGVIEAHRG